MPIHEYECTMCGGVSEFLEGITQEKFDGKCGFCGSENLKKILSSGVQSRTGKLMGSQGGKTCCGREERCDAVPCAQGAACHKWVPPPRNHKQESGMEEDKIKKEMMNLLFEKTKGLFSEKVIDYGTNPRNCGTMEKPDGYAKITGPCGDTVEIFLRVKNGRIEDIRYTTDGCMTSHAAVSAATVMVKGKSPKECIRINQSSILEHLGGMPDDAKHCALLAAMTLHRAMRNFAVRKKGQA